MNDDPEKRLRNLESKSDAEILQLLDAAKIELKSASNFETARILWNSRIENLNSEIKRRKLPLRDK